MKRVIIRIKKNHLLLMAAYFFYYSGLLIQHTAALHVSIIKNVLSVMTIICLLFDYLGSKKKTAIREKKIWVYVLLLIIAVSAVLSRDFFIQVLLLFALNISKLEKYEIIIMFRISIFLTFIITVLTVGFCFVGIIPNISSARLYGSAERWAYGFEHSQTISLFFLYGVLYFYIIRRKVSIMDFIFFQLCAFLITKIFDARNGFYSLEVFFLIYFIWAIFKIMFKKSLYKISDLLFVVARGSIGICAVLSLCFLRLYTRGDRVANIIDSFLTGRISMAFRTFSIYPLKLFNIMTYSEYRESLQSTMDNGYYYFAFRYGLICLFLLEIIAWHAAKFFQSENNECGLIALITIAISCAIANGFVSCYLFPFWIAAFYELQLGKKVSNGKGEIKKIDESIGFCNCTYL